MVWGYILLNVDKWGKLDRLIWGKLVLSPVIIFYISFIYK